MLSYLEVGVGGGGRVKEKGKDGMREGAGADVTEKEGEYGEEWLKLY